MEEERDFQEGSSWEQLLPLDLLSSAQRPAPTLVRMPIAQPITFSYLTCSHIFHYPLSTPLTLFNSTLGRRRVSLLPGPSGREFLARCKRVFCIAQVLFPRWPLRRLVLQMTGSAPPLAGLATEQLAADTITSLLKDANTTVLSRWNIEEKEPNFLKCCDQQLDLWLLKLFPFLNI